jgi:hypothetical protein
MADVTGKVYEQFVEYLLRRVGWAAGPNSGVNEEYLFGKAVPARCHTSDKICGHAKECATFSKKSSLPFGPWNNPDFFLTKLGSPFGCVHVTHWSSPKQCCYKFWRTVEDHFQYKTLFGHDFLSISFLFEALDPEEQPRLLQDNCDLMSFHGWTPANGTMHATNYDASLIFPLNFKLLQSYADALPSPMPELSAARRSELYHTTWESLNDASPVAKKQITHSIDLLRQALQSAPHPRYSEAAVSHLQDVCFRGRQLAAGLQPTCSRYRKGIQIAFILREVIGEYWGEQVDPDEALWRILTSPSRFPVKGFRQLLGLSERTTNSDMASWVTLLTRVPVRMVNKVPVSLLDTTAGVGGMVAWDPDTSMFIHAVRGLESNDLAMFREHVDALYEEYRQAYGMAALVQDLAHPNRVETKVQFVRDRYLNLSLDDFVGALVPEMLSPYNQPSHQDIISDPYNWPLEVILTMFDLGSYQHITATLPSAYESATGEKLRPYAYVNQLAQLVSHLIAGVPVGQYFSKGCRLDEEAFYKVIWPLLAECLWRAFKGGRPLSFEKTCENYRMKKAMRIISSPDMEPIKFLFRHSLPHIEAGPTLRGGFNQLSAKRAWSKAALTTATSGYDPMSGAIIQTQAVFEGNYSHKVKELSGRIRSVHLKLADDHGFIPEPDPGVHYLVIDGDWPVESKINLYEAGFSGIFEIGALDRLSSELNRLATEQ